jgi:hypothetical protein
VFLGEDLTYRQIFLDGRDLPADPNPDFMGYSVGHWEGDTLVIVTNGITIGPGSSAACLTPSRCAP